MKKKGANSASPGRTDGPKVSASTSPDGAVSAVPVYTGRTIGVGCPGTGLYFRLLRYHDEKEFKAAAARALAVSGDPSNVDAVGFCTAIVEDLLPGMEDVIPEACDRRLCTVTIGVLAEPVSPYDPGLCGPPPSWVTERRHWHHEIGHAADAATRFLPGVLGLANPDPALMAEIPAVVTETLCEAVDSEFFQRTPYPIESGLAAAVAALTTHAEGLG